MPAGMPAGVAQFFYSGASAKRIQPRTRRRAASRPPCLPSKVLADRLISSKAPAASPELMPTVGTPPFLKQGWASNFHLMDVLVKSHAASARIAAGLDGMLALREQHSFSGDDIAEMTLGIPRIIQDG